MRIARRIEATTAMGPQRIQRRRSKGWRMPEGSRYVGRPTKWGNPWTIGVDRDIARDESVALYRRALLAGSLAVTVEDARRELRGTDLACWCRLDEACHADVLLEVANSERIR